MAIEVERMQKRKATSKRGRPKQSLRKQHKYVPCRLALSKAGTLPAFLFLKFINVTPTTMPNTGNTELI